MYFTNILSHSKRKIFSNLLLYLLVLCLSVLSLSVWAPRASASTFTNGHFIDNALFLDSSSMSVDTIQSFFSSKSGTLKNRSFLMDCDVAGATSKQMYLSIGAPCGQTISAAHIIFYAAQIYGISPKVILTTMQKEQSLVTDPAPTTRAYNQAMGYACPDSGSCLSSSNFFYQIDNGAWALRYHYERANGNNNWWKPSTSWVCGTTKIYYSPNLYPRQNVSFYDDNRTLYTTTYIENAATSSLYCYTPHAYNNPQGLYGRSAFGTTGLYYSGSYNFVYYYELWFGSSYAFMYNGVDYSSVFDPTYYLNNNPDLRSAFGDNQLAAFKHFTTSGMNEGRQGSANFSLTSYRNMNSDLRWEFGTNLPAYYWHYTAVGRLEGRIATGNVILQPVAMFGGVDYSSIYNYVAYTANNPDIQKAYRDDDTGALWHFVTFGMKEGRLGNNDFNVVSYMSRYLDLRNTFGTINIRAYYIHYLSTGKAEGRTATGDYLSGTTILNKVDYSSIYDFDYYEKTNLDIKKTFGLNDSAVLQHFINTGTNEGRQGSASFNVYSYKAGNGDLRNAFGDNLKQYYMHYLNTGKKEGRSGI